MQELVLDKGKGSKDTLTRTIRFSGEDYDKIVKLADENNITFNNVVNQLVKFSLKHVKFNIEKK